MTATTTAAAAAECRERWSEEDVTNLAHWMEEADAALTPWMLRNLLRDVYRQKAEFILKRMLESEDPTNPSLPNAVRE